MDIIDFFKKDEFRIPIVFRKDDLKSELNNLLSFYIKELEKNNVSENLISKIKSFRKSCSYCVSNYLKGKQVNAYKNFVRGITTLSIFDSPLLTVNLGDDKLYRGRKNKENIDYSNEEMYHIPLNKRRIVSTQRYSFPGLPCLYACSSVYTCWAEIGRPSFDCFQVARLNSSHLAKESKLLDLSRIPQRIEELKAKNWFKEEDYFLYWPLLAICSIKVKDENEAFKPEYIFPQFLLEYILVNKMNYIGIKYASIKAGLICNKQFKEDWRTYVNYVFPSQSPEMKGQADNNLSALFSIGANKSGKDLSILSNMQLVDNVSIKTKNSDDKSDDEFFKKSLNNVYLFTKDGSKYPYVQSNFGIIEQVLNRDNYNYQNEQPFFLVVEK